MIFQDENQLCRKFRDEEIWESSHNTTRFLPLQFSIFIW